MPEQKIKADIQAMDADTHLSSAVKFDPDIAQFRAELSRFEMSLIIDIGVMLFLVVAILFAGIVFIH